MFHKWTTDFGLSTFLLLMFTVDLLSILITNLIDSPLRREEGNTFRLAGEDFKY